MTTDDETQPAQPAPATPSPGAQAASRARRIGGRPMPTATGASTGAGERSNRSPESPPPTPRPAAPREARPLPGWLWWIPAGVAAAAAVTFLVLGVAVTHQVWWGKTSAGQIQAERTQVLAAANTCIAAINSYDYRSLDQAEARGLACTTGKLASQYRDTMEKVIKPQAGTVQFTQSAQVNNGAVESASPDGKQWVILIFGQLSSTNSATGTTNPKLDVFTVRVTMDKVGGHWLVSAYATTPTA